MNLVRNGSILLVALQLEVATAQHKCDFSEFRPVHLSHFDKLALGGPDPQYPAEAEQRHWTGTVQIAVVVDVNGKVVKTCPMFAPGKPVPHEQFITAASAAAKQWTFQPNFGFGTGVRPKFHYVHHVLVFRFVMPHRHGETGVSSARFKPSDLAGFTKSTTEHMIVPLETEFFVTCIEGVILSKVDGKPMQNVLFEVRGPSEERTITKAHTDRSGRFRLKAVHPGVYLFKTTANGFQSVIGTIVVGVFTDPTPIQIVLPPGV